MNKERKKQSCYKTGSDLSTIQLYGRPTFILNQSNDTNKRKIGQRTNAGQRQSSTKEMNPFNQDTIDNYINNGTTSPSISTQKRKMEQYNRTSQMVNQQTPFKLTKKNENHSQ